MNENVPLVSLCIISYNSEKTILKSLESARAQTYKNIELIVSDDFSNDSTIELARKWIVENSNCFSSIQLIVPEKNTGVTGNCNRAYKAAHGKYIKDIGADDVLLPEYLEKMVDVFETNHDVDVLFSKVEYIDENGKIVTTKNSCYDYFLLSAEEQLTYILENNAIPTVPTPSVMYTKRIIEKMGYFDERFPMWEDGPMYLKLAENGIKMNLLPEKLLVIGVRKDSLSNKPSIKMRKSMALFCMKCMYKHEKYKNPFVAGLKYCRWFMLYYEEFFLFHIVLSFERFIRRR